MKWYILVIAPMDQVFVGPYETNEAAIAAANALELENQQYSAIIMSERHMLRNQLKYGALHIQPPSTP